MTKKSSHTPSRVFMPCQPCLSPETCAELGCDKRPKSEAYERGVKDCASYYAEPGRGRPQPDNYPSNPYNKEGDYARWQEYNRGWNRDAF